MNRMLFPAFVLAGPASAHTGTHLHAHGTDYALLAVGLGAIVVLAIAVISKLPK